MASGHTGMPDTSFMSIAQMENLAQDYYEQWNFLNSRIAERLSTDQIEGDVTGRSAESAHAAAQGFQGYGAPNTWPYTATLGAAQLDRGHETARSNGIPTGTGRAAGYPLPTPTVPTAVKPESGLPTALPNTGQQIRSFHTGIGWAYDPLWLQKEGREVSETAGFSTKIKFDDIFHQQALRIGDVLALNVLYSKNGIESEAQVYFKFRSIQPSALPTFDVTITSFPNTHDLLHHCSGPSRLRSYLLEQGFFGPNLALNRLSKNLCIYRDGACLGTYDYFKHAYHLWIEKMDMEAQAMGVAWRARRGRDRDREGSWGERMRVRHAKGAGGKEGWKVEDEG